MRRKPRPSIRLSLASHANMLAALLAATLVIGIANVAPAALPIVAIREYQKAAPNHLNLKVTKMAFKPHANADFQMVEMHATVTKVMRTMDKVKVGDKVKITWSVPGPNAKVAGDWAHPPKQGSTVEAYIKKDGKQFKPAAFSGSFEEVKKEEAKK